MHNKYDGTIVEFAGAVSHLDDGSYVSVQVGKLELAARREREYIAIRISGLTERSANTTVARHGDDSRTAALVALVVSQILQDIPF